MDEQQLRKVVEEAVDESVEAAFARIVKEAKPAEGRTLLRELGGGLAWGVGAFVAAGLVAYAVQRFGLADALDVKPY